MFFHSLLVSSEEADLSDRWQMPPAIEGTTLDDAAV